MLFAAAIVAGASGAPAGTVLAGTVGAVLVWDAGATAIDLGDQLGATALLLAAIDRSDTAATR